MQRTRHRAASSALALALVACTKLNAAYGVGDDGSATSSADTSTGGMSTTAAATSSNSETLGGGTSGAPTTSTTPTTATTGDDTSGDTFDDSGTEADPDPLWTEDCRTEFADEPCPFPLEFDGDIGCTLGPLIDDLEFDCDRSHAAMASLVFQPGFYVFGVPQPINTVLIVEGPGADPQACVPGVGGHASDVPATLEVSVRTNVGGFVDLVVRDADALCEVPPDCCTVSADGAEAACSDPGLRDCVVESDALCGAEWDEFCLRTALLLCGADCPEALP